MEKIISALLSIAIISGFITVPAYAENISGAYSKVLSDAVSQYGEFEKHSYFDSTGVGYVAEIDFDGDGTNELLFCTGEENNKPMSYSYIYCFKYE